MKKVFWGLFFITAGVFVIVDQFGNYTGMSLFNLLCTILLIPIFITSLFRLKFFGILFSLAFAAIIYKEQLNIEDINTTSILLTALLGSIGLSILFGKHHFCKIHSHKKNYNEVVINNPDGNEVDFSVSFGSIIKYVNSEDFKVANLKSSFGSMKVYFDNAKIKGDNATINLDVSFSGVELYFPKEWRIIDKVDSTLGAVEQKNNCKESGEKTVTLSGKVNLGGVEIFYI